MFVKLAFSVAAHLDSEIMIMDEVLAVGDMAFQKKCLTKMRSAAKQEGRTVLYVSHNMNTIRQLCDRCIVLDKGKVVFEGDVEEAIDIYLQNNAHPMGTEIELTQSRMKHLSTIVEAKITRIVLENKDKPVYEYKENIECSIFIKTYKKIDSPCLRIEIRYEDDTPIGATYAQNMNTVRANTETEFKCSMINPGLIPGRYKALVVLYEVNDMGTYHDLDAVWPGFVFDIEDTKGTIKIAWNRNHWGKICFEELKVNG